MNNVKVKICGLQRKEDIETVNRYKPDYAGFIINYPKSHRSKTPKEVEILAKELDPGIPKVGVFVDEAVEIPIQMVRAGILDIVQLHGHEDNAYIKALRAGCSAKIIQAFLIQGPEDIRLAAASEADYVLLDQGRGSGKVFDWGQISSDFPKPYFLAGGINPENMEAAYEATHPYALDISSGVETDGQKDPKKIEAVLAWRNRKEGKGNE